jgi:glutathione synthase/RimK-type ligase-like ATP-grasp enzyme
MRHITRLSVAPATFQSLIHKQSDIRVTIVGEKVFCAEILSQTDDDASVDWRRTSNPNLPHKHHDLPREVELRLLQYMKRLGLEYGAIDLVLDREEGYYFLEANPGGQWLWLDRILDLGITQSIADWLETCGRP